MCRSQTCSSVDFGNEVLALILLAQEARHSASSFSNVSRETWRPAACSSRSITRRRAVRRDIECRQGRRRHARHARRLVERLWPAPRQPLDHFVGEARHRGKIQARRESRRASRAGRLPTRAAAARHRARKAHPPVPLPSRPSRAPERSARCILDLAAATIGNAASRQRRFAQTRRGIVRPQRQAKFGAGGHHPVRLADALKRQVVDHDADV